MGREIEHVRRRVLFVKIERLVDKKIDTHFTMRITMQLENEHALLPKPRRTLCRVGEILDRDRY
jgi:hypothetical protein